MFRDFRRGLESDFGEFIELRERKSFRAKSQAIRFIIAHFTRNLVEMEKRDFGFLLVFSQKLLGKFFEF